MNINKVFLMGNLTRDPDFRQTPGGQSISTISIATNSFFTSRGGERQKRAEFHTIVLWGRQAEIANQYLRKGSSVFVEGRLQTRSWQDKEGNTRKVTEVVGERMQLGPRPAGASGAGNFAPSSNDSQEFQGPEAGFDNLKEEELPEINIDEEMKSDDIPF
jgi:single-strand DNA-binding protein